MEAKVCIQASAVPRILSTVPSGRLARLYFCARFVTMGSSWASQAGICWARLATLWATWGMTMLKKTASKMIAVT